jgi:DNA-binding NtrC family response regulator
MTEPPIKILIIDDDEHNLVILSDLLSKPTVAILTAADPREGVQLFLDKIPDIVITDLQMPGLNGIEVLDQIVAKNPSTEVILMTGFYTAESAVEAIKKGATDYITKPLDLPALELKIDSIVRDIHKRRRVLQIDSELLENFQFQDIIGRSPLMLNVFGIIRRVAPHYRTALVTGATGTGKESVARAFHDLSPVAQKTFAVCNCSALTETLFESELFGYVKGAFTGANQDKMGIFEFANGGTVFLDEIGDMPLAGQAKLLRVLQNQEVQRVGSPAVRKVDVRVVAATHRDLRALVSKGEFREDLFYRLSMVEVTLPKLSERQEDLRLLERHFVQKFAEQYKKNITGLTARVQRQLVAYGWPGNVRELANVIGNACMMVQGEVIDIGDLPAYLKTSERNETSDEIVSLDEMQRRYVWKAIERCGGNKARAAEMLRISRGSLYNIIRSTKEAEAAASGALDS